MSVLALGSRKTGPLLFWLVVLKLCYKWKKSCSSELSTGDVSYISGT